MIGKEVMGIKATASLESLEEREDCYNRDGEEVTMDCDGVVALVCIPLRSSLMSHCCDIMEQ